jgi:hypothetical protein
LTNWHEVAGKKGISNGTSMGCKNERAIPKPHALFFLVRHKPEWNTQHATRNSRTSKNFRVKVLSSKVQLKESAPRLKGAIRVAT